MFNKKIITFSAWTLLLLIFVFAYAKYVQNRQKLFVVQNTLESDFVATSTINNLIKPKIEQNTQIEEIFSVVRVVDGDTIVVLVGGVKEKVRMIGINTPETVDPRKVVQCFGIEASEKTKEILTAQKVILKIDKTQDDRDKYGRLLRYVYLPDGTFVNKMLLQEGYAFEYTYRVPYIFQKEFKQAEESARENKKGLWATGICGANTIK